MRTRLGLGWIILAMVLVTVRASVAAGAPRRGGGASSSPPPTDSSSAGNIGVTAKVGTLGAGGEVTIGLGDYLGVRVGGSAAGWNGDESSDDSSIYWDVELLTYGALLDIHPFGGGFRLSGGEMINKNKIRLRADLNKSVELDGQDYQLSDFGGEVTFNSTAPYAGIGYGNAAGADGRWHFSCDFGVMFQGSPKVDAHATASDPELQPAVDAAVEREKADIQDDAKGFKYYPVISLGVSFRF